MILLNNVDKKLIDTLRSCLRGCYECKIAVAYIRNSGLNPIMTDLENIIKKGGSVRILTSDQMGITEKEAIVSLLDVGAHVKLFANPNKIFHPKAYIFKGDNKGEFIIGSSNLSRSALFEGIEWNLYFDSSIPVSSHLEGNFDKIWHSNETQDVTKENIDSLFNTGSEEIVKNLAEREDAVRTILPSTLTEILEKNVCYSVSKRPDRTTTWKFNLAVNKVNKFLSRGSFYVIVRCDHESPNEIVFAIPSEHLSEHIFPYANQGKSPRYLFEIHKRTYQFNWQRSIKMDGKPFIVMESHSSFRRESE
jgi:HKD family nuclease